MLSNWAVLVVENDGSSHRADYFRINLNQFNGNSTRQEKYTKNVISVYVIYKRKGEKKFQRVISIPINREFYSR